MHHFSTLRTRAGFLARAATAMIMLLVTAPGVFAGGTSTAPFPFTANVNPAGYTTNTTPTFSWGAVTSLYVDHYEFKLDNDSWLNVNNVLTFTPSNALSTGLHVARVRSSDGRSIFSDEALLGVVIDTRAPDITAFSPSSATLGQATTFTATVGDDTELDGCTYSVDGASQGSMSAGANGAFTFSKAFQSSGEHTISMLCSDKAGNSVSSQRIVQVTAAAADTTPNAYYSSISITKTQVTANNVDSASVTVTVRNSSGNPIAGKVVTLETTRPSSDNISTNLGTTNSLGQAFFTVYSPVVGSSTFKPLVDGAYLNNNATVSFYAVSPNPSTDTTASTNYSSISTNKTQVSANTGETATITVLVRNSAGNVLANKYVILETTRPGVDTVVNVSATTNSLGNAIFFVRSTTVGTSVYKPIVDNAYLANNATITYYTSNSGDSTVNINTTSVSANKQQLGANTGEVAVIAVQVRNGSGTALAGKTVSLQTNRLGYDTIIAANSVTNDQGVANFYVRSTTVGQSTYIPYADGYTLNAVTVNYVSTSGPIVQSTVAAGSLVKLPCYAGSGVNDACRAVYFVGSDAKRHAFPNSKVYFSWYANYANVQTIDANTMSSMPIGKNVNYRPGTRLVKFITNPTVYAVSKGGVLRAVASESLAAYLYGNNWASFVDDISDAFVGDYMFGIVIDSTYSFNPTNEMQNVPNILTNNL